MLKKDEERFWSKVKITNLYGCWEWQAYTDKDSYGRFKFNGKMLGAHRISYEQSVGTIPKDLLVLHNCNNPPCVNPSHLRIGTDQDNADDRKEAGNNPEGERHGNAKLIQSQVDEIRALRDKVLQKELSNRFRISIPRISEIQTGKGWK